MVELMGILSEKESISRIDDMDHLLENHFQHNIIIDKKLTRQIVSFQDNKKRPVYVRTPRALAVGVCQN